MRTIPSAAAGRSAAPAGVALLALLAILLPACGGGGVPETAGLREVPPFSLTERDGRTVTRDDLLGRPWIAAFIFTRCAGTCPIMTRSMAGLQGSLGGPGAPRLVSITVDPAFDTPEVLADYAEAAGADPERWLFLTGEAAEIQSLARDGFLLAAGPGAEQGVSAEDGGEAFDPADIVHSQRLVLVDAAGRIRGTYDGTDREAVARLEADVRGLAGPAGT